MKICIVIPAHNEEKRIRRTLEEYGRFFEEILRRKKIDKIEILIIINKTIDKTEEIVKEYRRKYKEIRYLRFEPGGKGFAIIEGFKEALKKDFDLIGFVDADMATPPEVYYDLIKNIKNYDGIIASRWLRDSVVTKRTLLRKITSGGFNFAVRALFLMPYHDTQCGAKLFKRETIKKILDEISMTEWAFDVNLLYSCRKHNFKIKEYPTIWEDKEGSGITDVLRISIQMFSGIVRLRLINSFFEPILRPFKIIPKITHKIMKKNE